MRFGRSFRPWVDNVAKAARSARKTKRASKAGKESRSTSKAAARGTRAGRAASKPKPKRPPRAKAKTAVKRVKPKATKRAAAKRTLTGKPAGKKVATARKKTVKRKTAKKSAARIPAKGTKKVAKVKKVRKAVGSATGRKSGSASRTKKRSAPARGGLRAAQSKRTPSKQTSSQLTASQPSSATSQDPIQFPELDRRVPKTHLKARELRKYAQLLLRKRAELAGDVQHLAIEVTHRGPNSGGGAEHSAMPIHMADLGSDNWEKEFTMGLIANEHDRIREIDDALERIADKTYGTCAATHRPISDARLRAKPWAKYCIDYARAREEGRA